jgi:hypothetical protein
MRSNVRAKPKLMTLVLCGICIHISLAQTKPTPLDSIAVISITQKLLDAVAVGDTIPWKNTCTHLVS